MRVTQGGCKVKPSPAELLPPHRRAISGLEGWVECFERASLSCTIFAGGLTDEGAIEGHASLKQAYDMGAAIKQLFRRK